MSSAEIDSPDSINNPALRISNLRKKYGDLTAVDGISFDIFKGEIFGFLGPNGAGKTTTINMICGLLPQDGGDIYFSGRKIEDRKEFKTHIGICPQENIFWQKLTCREQLVFMYEMYGAKGSMVKDRVGLLLEAMALSDKADVQANKLSGGMKRRLNICLALVHDPDILILDEPEAGLDPQSRIMVREYLRSLSGEKTIIFTTHNMDEADRISDRIAIIDRGKLLLTDTPDNLKKHIGEGDIMEIEFEKTENSMIENVINRLSSMFDKVTETDSGIIIKSKNLVGSIPELTDVIKNFGIVIREIKIRENTLEDVFISLTGRTLRQ
ncbi:MAG: ABC transporter ATP-binding protein [bacterium]|nr:ABC transporter ATP-binding protein [bacterium]